VKSWCKNSDSLSVNDYGDGYGERLLTRLPFHRDYPPLLRGHPLPLCNGTATEFTRDFELLAELSAIFKCKRT
jgi:hypothetical protein